MATDITQAVKISFPSSQHFFLVPASVSQCFYLGPLHFLIFNDDLPGFVLKSSKVTYILLFADYAKLVCEIKTETDSTNLQLILNKFVLWSKINYILLNIDKFKVIYFISKTDPILKQHKINDFSLSKINSIKDLETYFEIDLGFKMNHKIILNKSYKMLGFLYRNTNKFRNPLYALKT